MAIITDNHMPRGCTNEQLMILYIVDMIQIRKIQQQNNKLYVRP